METVAVVFNQPEQVALQTFTLPAVGEDEVLVGVEWSGVSAGTERLLWSGRMPPFPGLGYPLVPGYEAVGTVLEAGPTSQRTLGERVFVPGAKCYGTTRALFGGSASRLVVPGARAVPLGGGLAEEGVLLALAATAYHAIRPTLEHPLPELIVGHGALGRLLARLVLALGGTPVVWEVNPVRRAGTYPYQVIDPAADTRTDYRSICDVSGDAGLLDTLVGRLAHGGEVILAGFYHEPVRFAFPPAFLREARFRVAAEWRPDDLTVVANLAATRRLDLSGIVTHQTGADHAADAYSQAFTDQHCIKMVLDWRHHR